MIQLLYSFGLGFAFVVGIFTGCFVCTVATRKGREELKQQIADHNDRVEKRLLEYVENTGRIALSLETVEHYVRNK